MEKLRTSSNLPGGVTDAGNRGHQLSVPATPLELSINSLLLSARLLSAPSSQPTASLRPWKLAQPAAHYDLFQKVPRVPAVPLLATGGSLRPTTALRSQPQCGHKAGGENTQIGES